MSVLLGNGDGTFQPQRTFGAGDHPVSIAVADLNGDGKPDIVVANDVIVKTGGGQYGTLTVLPGQGNGSFGPANHPGRERSGRGPGREPQRPSRSDPRQLRRRHRERADGRRPRRFPSQQTYPVGVGPISVAATTINGRTELVVANFLGSTVSAIVDNGAGGFGSPTTFPVGAIPSRWCRPTSTATAYPT